MSLTMEAGGLEEVGVVSGPASVGAAEMEDREGSVAMSCTVAEFVAG